MITIGPSLLVLFKNWIQADYHRFIPAEEYGSDFECEDWHTVARAHMLQESIADFWHTVVCRSQNMFFYFNYMTSTHEWEPELHLHWPWKCLGGLWWNEAYVFWWFLESEETQKPVALVLNFFQGIVWYRIRAPTLLQRIWQFSTSVPVTYIGFGSCMQMLRSGFHIWEPQPWITGHGLTMWTAVLALADKSYHLNSWIIVVN